MKYTLRLLPVLIYTGSFIYDYIAFLDKEVFLGFLEDGRSYSVNGQDPTDIRSWIELISN